MINRVKFLVEELQRHDPEKYLMQHVDIVSRGANIAVEFAGMHDEARELDGRVAELCDCCMKIGNLIKDEKLTDEILRDKIKETLNEYEAI